MNFYKTIHGFFFERISASGFGLMRIAWAMTAFTYFLLKFTDTTFYYSNEGVIPLSLGHLMFRNQYRFTLLDYITDPTGVFLLYLLLLFSLLVCAVGILPRISTIVSFVLICSFHERNLHILSGGDTVIRNIGLLLAVAPGTTAYSFSRMRIQWKNFKKKGKLIAPISMSIWPYRLLLWQLIIIYLCSGYDKLQGYLWRTGTAASAIMHHPYFFRWNKEVADLFAFVSPFISDAVISFELLWILLLIPKPFVDLLPDRLPRVPLKRILIGSGVVFHTGIFVFMNVGSFAWAMVISYFGLLRKDDLRWFRKICNKNHHKTIIVLNDFHCRLCMRSAFILLLCNWLGRVKCVDYHDRSVRRKHAPNIPLQALNHHMHVVHDKRVERGFYAFRYLTHHLPPLWPLAPILYIPGVPLIGNRIYNVIAARRKKCVEGECAI